MSVVGWLVALLGIGPIVFGLAWAFWYRFLGGWRATEDKFRERQARARFLLRGQPEKMTHEDWGLIGRIEDNEESEYGSAKVFDSSGPAESFSLTYFRSLSSRLISCCAHFGRFSMLSFMFPPFGGCSER